MTEQYRTVTFSALCYCALSLCTLSASADYDWHDSLPFALDALDIPIDGTGDWADSVSFQVDLLMLPSGDTGDWAETAQFSVNLCPVNRGWADSGSFAVNALLLSTEPPADGTLPKTQNNIIVCVFDAPITLPPSGDPLVIIQLTDPNNDVSGSFRYSVDPNDTGDPTGATLKAIENGETLADQTWYRVRPAPLLGVCPFTLDVCTLRGDCNNSGRVTTYDYSCVKVELGERTGVRADLDGSGRVTAADYSVVKAHLGGRAPDKP